MVGNREGVDMMTTEAVATMTEREKLIERLRYGIRDIETGEPLDEGAFAHVTVDDIREVIAALASECAAHSYATRLLVSLMEKHYPDRHPDWSPLPDLMGVLTQIDNLSTG